jgi:hypothetical protein
MSVKQKRWQAVEKASISIATLVDRYLSCCQSAGMHPKTIRGYNEKLQINNIVRTEQAIKPFYIPETQTLGVVQ